MKKIVLAVIGAATLMAAPAVAQRAPQFNWAGYYAGVDVGYVWADSVASYDLAPDYVAYNTGNGALIGGHFGYRRQFQSNFVLGYEADIWGALDAKSTVSLVVPAANFVNFRTTAGGSVRATAGYAFQNSLIYGTGGVAFIAYQGCTSVDITTTACNINTGAGLDARFKDVAPGWTIGIGTAYAVNQNIFARFEYLYSDFGTIKNMTPGLASGYTKTDINAHIVRFGLSWKFGS